MQSSIQAWEDFYRRYVWEDILELASEFPDRKSLYVDYSDISAFDLDLSHEIIEHPDMVLKHATEALRQLDLPADINNWQPFVRITGLPEKIRRRDFRDEHIDHLICVDGMALKVSEVSPVIVNGAFKCQKCGEITFMPQHDDGKFVEPFECENDTCGRKGAFKLVKDQSEFLNGQKIRLSELPEDLSGGEKCQTVDCIIRDDLVGFINPGQRISIVGILRAFQRTTKEGKTTYFNFILDIISFKVQDGGQTIYVSPEDRVRIQEMASQPDFVDKVVTSFAPTVFGWKDIKEAILVSMTSNGFKLRKDGTPQRDFSHVLVCSDPGMSKSTLKHAAKSIKPDIVLTSGTGATKAGLTAAALKDDFDGGKYTIEAGALPLADGSCLFIDELDKFDKESTPCLNDGLSNCQFEKDAAGVRMKLWTRCNVVALMNPKNGRFDQYESNKASQINLQPDTLSRFDLVFVKEDMVDETNDRNVAGAIVDAWMDIDQEKPDLISQEDLQKFLVMAREIHPVFDPDLKNKIINRHVFTRNKSYSGRISVTSRYVEALLRISKAEAQMSLSQTVTRKHFDRALALLEKSLMSVGTDEKGQLDADIIESGKSNSQREKIKSFLKIIKDNESDGMASLIDVLEKSKKKGISLDETKNLIDNLKNSGDIFEPRRGYLKVSV